MIHSGLVKSELLNLSIFALQIALTSRRLSGIEGKMPPNNLYVNRLVACGARNQEKNETSNYVDVCYGMIVLL
jgi:hypothetical protein